jgi:microcystin-dependent protein
MGQTRPEETIMASPFVGEIRMFAGNFAPQGWAFCNGQTLAIAQNDALFALIGTTFGGDGVSTFQLPNLQSRIPVHQGTNPNNGITYIQGQISGEESVALTFNQMPQHIHPAQALSTDGNQQGPAGGVWASSNLGQFSSNSANGTMNPAAISSAGSNSGHTNIMPYLAVNFIISLFGIFPTRN